MSIVQDNYLDFEELTKELPIRDININDLVSADSYNETKILKRMETIEEADKLLLCKAAIQMAIIGYGKKNYGSIRLNEKEILPLKTLFEKLKIKHMERNDVLYNDDELSARRLIRLYRYNIQHFIKNQKKPSYLWTKYSVKDSLYMHCCFPGAEHLITDQKEALYLLDTYKNLDLRQNTKFCIRIQRVFIARNIFKPDDIILNKYLWQLITTTKNDLKNLTNIICIIVNNLENRRNIIRKTKRDKKK